MVKFWPSLEDHHIEFINKQPLFFVASAPLVGDHVNLSPKGHPARSFAILDSNKVAYLDATGSGSETISHVYENGRVTVMFCSFGVSPQIMRLFCRGNIVEKEDKGFEELRQRMGKNVELTGARAIIALDVFKVQTSCGFGVPLIGKPIDAAGEEKILESSKGFQNRDTMDRWSASMEEKRAIDGWQREYNYRSLDRLTGLRSARKARGQWLWLEDVRVWAVRILRQWDSLAVGMLCMLLGMYALLEIGILQVNL